MKRFNTRSAILALAAICVAWYAAYQLLSAGPSNRAHASSGDPPAQYTLDVTRPQGYGTVRLNPPNEIRTTFPTSETYSAGTPVTLTAYPAAGYRFLQWSNLPPTPHTSTQNPVTITMNGDYTVALGKDVRVHFLQQYTLTITVTGSGTVSATPSGGVYDPDTVVSLRATASSGWAFDHWEIDMTGTANPKSITMNSNKTVRAVFLPLYTLTVLKTGSGTVTLNPAGGVYKSGQTVSLTATASSGWRFDHWEIDLSGTSRYASITMTSNKTVRAVFVNWVILSVSTVGQGTVTADPAAADWKYTINTSVELEANAASGWRFDHWTGNLTGSANPTSITMNADKSVTAYFIQRVTLMLHQTGEGTISPDIETPHVYDINTNASVSATAAMNWRFKEWSGDFSSTSASCNIPMSSDKTVTGTFIRQYLLTTLAGTGGTVSPATGLQDKDSTVTVTPTPSQGWVFDHWEIDLSGSENPGSVEMDSDKTVKAMFKQQRILTVVRQGGGGTVSPGPGTHVYLDGEVARLDASDAAPWYFYEWQGALSGSETPQDLTMSSDKTVTAVFKQKFTLTMIREGDDGSLSPSIGSHVYFDGDDVSVSASGAGNGQWVFDHWTGHLSGTTTPQSLTMNANKSVTGVFLPMHTLTTSIEGQGTGSVTPSGGEYKHGTEVQLSATAGAKSWFVEWHNDLTGSTTPATLEMSSQKHVSAEFDTNVLTVQKVGQGEVSPSGGSYGQNEEVNITATPKEGWVFDHWEIDLSGTDSSTSLLMNEDKTVKAVFKELFTLTMAKAPGTATGSVDPAPGEHLYKDGDEATLSASDGSTWLFANWSGDLGGNTTPVTVVMDEDKTITGNFVTIDKIQYNNGTEHVDVPDPLYVLKGDSVSFKAIPNPEGATWPQGKPAWGGTSGASGTGSTKSVTFNTASSTSSDYKTVTAECGATRSVNVLVVDAELVSITFTSDHGQLTDETATFAGVGTPYGEPEWTANGAANWPITHTMDTAVSASIEIDVTLSGLAFRLEGRGAGSCLNFTATDTSTGGLQSVTATAEAPLPNQIDVVQGNIDWTIVFTGIGNATLDIGSSGPHEVFVIWGTPHAEVYEQWELTHTSIATYKRVSTFVTDWCSGVATTQDLAQRLAIGADQSTYFGNWPQLWTVWQAMDAKAAGSSQMPLDCYGAAIHALECLDILGVRSQDKGLITAHPSTDAGTSDYPSDCSAIEYKPQDPGKDLELRFQYFAGGFWYLAENGFRVRRILGTSWIYMTVHDPWGPFWGSTSDEAINHKQSLYQIMDAQRTAKPGYTQSWGDGAYAAPNLP